MSDTAWLLLGPLLTIAAYATGRVLHSRFRSPLATPVFAAAICLVVLLRITGVGYDDFRAGAAPLIWLLGPATAALAIPLYKHRASLLCQLVPACAGLLCGMLSTMVSALLFAVSFRLPHIVTAAIGIKSITAPIAVELAPLIGGDPSVAVTCVVVTGILGAMFGPLMLDWAGISSPLSRGLAFGTISHGIGTSQAIAEGELQGATSGVAMSVAGVVGAAVAPYLVPGLLHLLR